MHVKFALLVSTRPALTEVQNPAKYVSPGASAQTTPTTVKSAALASINPASIHQAVLIAKKEHSTH
jgi:hypothetical protein